MRRPFFYASVPTTLNLEIPHNSLFPDQFFTRSSFGSVATGISKLPQSDTSKEMLQAILAAERQAGNDYTQRAIEADEFGDKGLAVQLEDMVRDEMGHSEESERMLRDWPV